MEWPSVVSLIALCTIPRPGGVLGISSDGDDGRRDFFELEIFDSGIFLAPKIWFR